MWDHIIGIWTVAWTYKISLLPVLVTYALFDLPAIVRKLTRIAYVPIYFMFFPLGHSDRLYAEYFKEDDMYFVGAELTDEQRRKLRKRIKVDAVISMIFAALVAPWLCGFISAFYLNAQQFTEFLYFLFVVKAALLLSALRTIRVESRAVMRGNAFFYVIALYVLYLILVWHGLTSAHEWTQANLNSGGVVGLMWALLRYAYADIFVNFLIVSLLTWAVITKFTDPEYIDPMA